MFLNQLNDNQKNLFLDLAIKAAEINGIVEAEKDMLLAFAKEMNITSRFETAYSEDEILNQIVKCSTTRSKKIILFEIYGIIFADNAFDNMEKEFIDKISEKFEIPDAIEQEMIKYIHDYAELYKNIVKLVL